jgi:hypothetical protein
VLQINKRYDVFIMGNGYLPLVVPTRNNGPAWLAIFVGAAFAAYGNKLEQQIGLTLIGVGATKLIQ